MSTARSRLYWKRAGAAITLLTLLLWIAAEAGGFVGNREFLGRVVMANLVLAGLSTWRSDA